MENGQLSSIIAGEGGEPAVMTKFSVIVPVFNKVATLSTALESLYSQTWRQFEVIAVDDGSIDGSLDLLEQYARKGRLRLFRRNIPGPGGYAARNLGARQARYPWLTFLDADDLLMPDHLARFAKAISTHPDLELFVNAFQKMEGTKRLPTVRYIEKGKMLRSEALCAFAKDDFIHMNAVCINRTRFHALGAFPAGRYRRGGDVYFWLKALCNIEAIHYDDAVTSLWVLDHSGVTKDANNLSHRHPGLDVLVECERLVSIQEMHYLKKAVNRKVIAWATERKVAGNSVVADLLKLSVGEMNLDHWLRAVSLVLPNAVFRMLKEVRGKGEGKSREVRS